MKYYLPKIIAYCQHNISLGILFCVISGLALLASACKVVESTGPSGASAQFAGTWAYETSLSTLAVTTQGTIVLNSDSEGALTGTYNVIERNESGTTTRYQGTVSGRAASPTTLDFDVQLPSETRRHIGAFLKDNPSAVQGNYFVITSGNNSIPTPFTMRRVQ